MCQAPSRTRGQTLLTVHRTLLRQRWMFKTPHPDSSTLVLNGASSPARHGPAASGQGAAGWLSARISL